MIMSQAMSKSQARSLLASPGYIDRIYAIAHLDGPPTSFQQFVDAQMVLILFREADGLGRFAAGRRQAWRESMAALIAYAQLYGTTDTAPTSS
jgi:hypothetical protein